MDKESTSIRVKLLERQVDTEKPESLQRLQGPLHNTLVH